jgi:hypothetical protein
MCLVTLREWLGLSLRIRPLHDGGRKCICTEAIILSLIESLSGFEEIKEMPLDYVALGFATPNDLLRIARSRPDLLKEMKPTYRPRLPKAWMNFRHTYRAANSNT